MQFASSFINAVSSNVLHVPKKASLFGSATFAYATTPILAHFSSRRGYRPSIP
jgi:hypothetical protein